MTLPADPTWFSDVQAPLEVHDPQSVQWDDEADVIVVGFGGAGACAAIEAADRGARVLVLDRFMGGGATVGSGGVCYAGGGTKQQKEAGVEDTPEEMFKYLSLETQGCVQDSTLNAFCHTSTESVAWLERENVPFEGSLCPYKTSYPTNRHRLYHSGNETVTRYSRHARPAPRGHIANGKKGLRAVAGPAFFQPLHDAVVRRGIPLRTQTRATRLVTDEEGSVVGVECVEIPRRSIWAGLHRLLAAGDTKLYRFVPALGSLFRSMAWRIERNRAVGRRLRARQGVILSAGGFIFNREMVKHYAPKYFDGLPLGTAGDDGSGIRLGESAGGVADRMDRVSAWRFINPPLAWAMGIIVNGQGERYCDETVYGSHLGERMCEDHGGKAILIVNRSLYRRALKEILPGKVMPFQWMAAASNMFFNSKKGRTLEDLAGACGLNADKLRATIEAYNSVAAGKTEDPFGKPRKYSCSLEEGPYYAMDVSADSKLFPCPMITFGGLVVDEETGLVKRADGSTIRGLYAAGRTAVGIASNSYVSGLSLADCVFSGRRAGRHAASRSMISPGGTLK
jgi:3-oxo-5alpha-steroid 4-dehydrogenase